MEASDFPKGSPRGLTRSGTGQVEPLECRGAAAGPRAPQRRGRRSARRVRWAPSEARGLPARDTHVKRADGLVVLQAQCSEARASSKQRRPRKRFAIHLQSHFWGRVSSGFPCLLKEGTFSSLVGLGCFRSPGRTLARSLSRMTAWSPLASCAG